MTISTEDYVQKDGWKIRKIYNDGEFSHYALIYQMEKGHSTNPFDSVHASGGLLTLKKDGHSSVTFTGVLDGLNKYKQDADMPRRIFNELKAIGPY